VFITADGDLSHFGFAAAEVEFEELNFSEACAHDLLFCHHGSEGF
jgi:hypothetical protein